MNSALRPMLMVQLVLVCGPVVAQEGKAALPKVLIIGDSVYQQHARGVTDDLKGLADVQFAAWPKGVLPNSTSAVKHLDRLLGFKDAAGTDVPVGKRPTWDLIHFNVGLGDLIYCVPNIKSHRVLPHYAGGVIRTDAMQYEKNLDSLVRLLKEKTPSAKIAWASTTPIRHSRENVFKPGTEIEYNQIAERVMKKHDVSINDMHAYAVSIMDMDKPGPHGFDPFFFDNKPLHPPVVDAIVRELGLEPIQRENSPDAK
jgi:hypothetical protein